MKATWHSVEDCEARPPSQLSTGPSPPVARPAALEDRKARLVLAEETLQYSEGLGRLGRERERECEVRL